MCERRLLTGLSGCFTQCYGNILAISLPLQASVPPVGRRRRSLPSTYRRKLGVLTIGEVRENPQVRTGSELYGCQTLGRRSRAYLRVLADLSNREKTQLSPAETFLGVSGCLLAMRHKSCPWGVTIIKQRYTTTGCKDSNDDRETQTGSVLCSDDTMTDTAKTPKTHNNGAGTGLLLPYRLAVQPYILNIKPKLDSTSALCSTDGDTQHIARSHIQLDGEHRRPKSLQHRIVGFALRLVKCGSQGGS